MTRILCTRALLGLTAALSGCAMCDHVDDYSGAYYGGYLADRLPECDRVGSVASGYSEHLIGHIPVTPPRTYADDLQSDEKPKDDASRDDASKGETSLKDETKDAP